MGKEKVVINFDPVQHKYTDIVGNTYISVTTLIGEYEYKFSDKELDIAKACERIGKNPRHPKYLKYKGKTHRQLINEWTEKRITAQDRGNARHDYLEQSIKFSNNYNNVLGSRDRDTQQLYTIDDLLETHDYGVVDEAKLIEKEFDSNYPSIFRTLVALMNNGWKLYAEIAVYDSDKLVSGLIDLLAVKGTDFLIIDWKTNEAPIRFEAGHYEKDNDGNMTDVFTFAKNESEDKHFKAPLKHLELSTGNKYGLQLSLYAFLVEQRGFTHKGSVIFHIRHDEYTQYYEEVDKNPDLLGKSVVDIVSIPYYREEIIAMLNDYELKRYNGMLSINFKN